MSGIGSGDEPKSARRLREPALTQLAALCRRLGLEEREERRLAALTALVAEHERAPTSVSSPSAVVDDHLADSLIALSLPEVRDATAVIDLGSGAGFPGLPLAIVLPLASVVLLEASRRKVAFLHEAISVAAPGNARAVHARSETFAESGAPAGLVTARAVSSLPVVIEYASPLLAVGGHLVAWRGRRDEQTEADGDFAARMLGLRLLRVEPVTPYSGVEARHLHVYVKVAETPTRFPRRPGMAEKRPLVPGRRVRSDRPPL